MRRAVDLLQITKSTLTLKKFIEGEGLYQAIQLVGDNELKAAQDVAKHLRQARDKRSTLNRVLGHLESAHQHYLSIYSRATNEILRKKLFDKACRLDFETCCLMALCHKYLDSGDVYLHEALFNAARARNSGMESLRELNEGCSYTDFVDKVVTYDDWHQAWQEVTPGLSIGDLYLRGMPVIANPVTWVNLWRHVVDESEQPESLWFNSERFGQFIKALAAKNNP